MSKQTICTTLLPSNQPYVWMTTCCLCHLWIAFNACSLFILSVQNISNTVKSRYLCITAITAYMWSHSVSFNRIFDIALPVVYWSFCHFSAHIKFNYKMTLSHGKPNYKNIIQHWMSIILIARTLIQWVWWCS